MQPSSAIPREDGAVRHWLSPRCQAGSRWNATNENGISSALLQRQTDANRTIDAANDLSLPFQYRRVSTEKIAENSSTHGKNHGADEAQQNKDNPQDRQLKHHRSVFRPHELGKECE